MFRKSLMVVMGAHFLRSLLRPPLRPIALHGPVTGKWSGLAIWHCIQCDRLHDQSADHRSVDPIDRHHQQWHKP